MVKKQVWYCMKSWKKEDGFKGKQPAQSEHTSNCHWCRGKAAIWQASLAERLGSLASKLFQVLQVARSFELKQKLVSRAGDTFLLFLPPNKQKSQLQEVLHFMPTTIWQFTVLKKKMGFGGSGEGLKKKKKHDIFPNIKRCLAAHGTALLSQNPEGHWLGPLPL